MQITTVIIAQNEAKSIARAVQSALPIGSVIVIDGGSTDQTIPEAERAGAKVIKNPWPGYAAQRQFALENVRADWICFLDSDEEITPTLADEIKSLDFSARGYRIPRRSLFLGKWMNHGAWARDHVLRLFHRPSASVAPRAVHEEVTVAGTVTTLSSHLLHYAQNDFETVGRKFTLYIPLMAKEIAERRDSVGWFEIVIRCKSAFFKNYFLRRGFLDGWRGFVLASWGSISVLAKYAEAKRMIESR